MMAEPSPGSWRVSVCPCGCGAVRLHTFANDMPVVTITFDARQAVVLAGQLVDAADAVTGDTAKAEGETCH